MRCFGCVEERHTVRACPKQNDPAQPVLMRLRALGPPLLLLRYRSYGDPTRGEREVGDKGEEEGGVGCKHVEEKTGEEKSVEQDGGDSGRRGGEAAEGRVAWGEQMEEEEPRQIRDWA
ncbi:unnamed protein product, partial [Pleuronectes platessa]